MIKRRKPIVRRKPLRRVSLRRAKQLRRYSIARAAFLKRNPVCDVETCFCPSKEVHHVDKRRGARLLDETGWMAVCRACHRKIEQNKAWARAGGYLLDF